MTHRLSRRRFFLAASAFLAFLGAPAAQAQSGTTPPQPYHKWAQTPPMGWNSWDAFATTVTEAQIRAQTDYMARHLKAHGWQYMIVDIQWYEPNATGFNYREGAPVVLDANGRLQPAANKFPSAANGAGFKALSDYVHRSGLKFGVHLMRGIPRQAVREKRPVLGTNVTAADIADTRSTCPWNSDMYGVDMSKPGAQEYYNSVFQLLADWGVDFVKVDDLSRPYHQAEIEGIRRAIDRTRRPIVLSTSPGETPLGSAEHVSRNANMWRMSDDFWDTWPALFEQFERTRKWAPYIGAGHFPDADMLPLGAIRQVPGYDGGPWTRFTKDEQVTMMTLWALARSPLFMGGDLTKNDPWTLSLLTNDEMLQVNQKSVNNRQLWNRDGYIVWTADIPRSKDKYLGVFNTRGSDIQASRAAYRSPLLTRDTPGHQVEIDVDITGAKKLYLVVDDGGDNFNADHADWVEPRLVGPGGERKLSEIAPVKATTGWGQYSTTIAAGGKPMQVDGKPVAYGIGVHSPSVVEFDVPDGYTRFRASGALDDGGTSQNLAGATVRFLIFTQSPYDSAGGAKIPVALQGLGLGNAAIVRDLWAKKDLGRMQGEFVPLIPSHGAGLYRLSPSK